MPYASWPGRWQMKAYSPGWSKVTCVVRVDSARTVTSVGTSSCTGSVPTRWAACVGRRADDPLVFDRVVVLEGNRDRHAGFDGDRFGHEARVAELDRHVVRDCRGRRAAGGEQQHRHQHPGDQLRRPAPQPQQRRHQQGAERASHERRFVWQRLEDHRLQSRGSARRCTAVRWRRRPGRSAGRPRCCRCAAWSATPRSGTHSMPASPRRSSSRRVVAGWLCCSRRPSRSPGSKRRQLVGQQVHVGVDAIGGLLAERQDAQRHPRVVGRDRQVDGRAVADLLAALERRVAVEDGRQEDRAALGVEVEHLGRVGRQAEAVLLGPDGHVGAAALEDGDVERIDPRLRARLRRPPSRARSPRRRRARTAAAAGPSRAPGAAASRRRHARRWSGWPAAGSTSRTGRRRPGTGTP